MSGIDYGDLFAWMLIAAGGAFALTSTRLPMGAAIAAAALTGMVTKTLLLGTV